MMWMMMMLALQGQRMPQSPTTTMRQPPPSTNDNDMGASAVIGVTTMTAILQTTHPENVTISWTMLTNNDDDDAHNGDDV